MESTQSTKAPVLDAEMVDVSQLKRTLGSRHLTMIALGSSIGMGLWLGSGTSLKNGGPAAMLVGYLLAGSVFWAVSQSIGEMAIMYPLPSAFVQWTEKFVCRPAAFALGWAYCLYYIVTIANELQGIVTVLSFWTTAVPTAAWITIFWLVIISINIGAVKVFGEVEVVTSSIKFGWIFVVIISMIVISAGGAPSQETIGFRYFKEDAFTNGFKGFLSVLPTCVFAMSGSENASLVAAETQNPRRSIPHAVNSIWMRLSLFYILGSLMITITVDPRNPNLFGNSGTSASPFVIAYRDAGLDPLAHIMNAVILISVLSTGSIGAYGGARTLMGLADLGMAPKVFLKTDRVGRPWWALVVILGAGGGLGYINVSETGVEIFTWFSSLTALFSLFGWGMICLSHLRFRYTWKSQGRDVQDLPWKTWTFPFAACWGLIWCIILTTLVFYLALWPLGGRPTAEGFFGTYISVPLIVFIYLGAQLYWRGRLWVDAGQIDLDRGRRFYPEEDGDLERTPRSSMKNYLGRLNLQK